MKAPVVLLAFILCGFAATASAATLVVTKTEDTNDGVCDADCSLREAVAAAPADDTIVFSSLFNTPQTITLALDQIAITRNLTINGPGQDVLTISGNHTNRIFRISGTVTVSLSGMKVSNGLAAYSNEFYGGGIYVVNSVLTLTRMTVSNNEARYTNQLETFGYGGGVYVDAGTLNVVSSSINNNAVPPYPANVGGGGIYGRYSTMNITGSTIDSNADEGINGAGIVSQPSMVNVVDSVVTNNSLGGLVNGSGHTSVSGSVIKHNGGGIGGGDSASTLAIDRSVISDNEPGGGVLNHGTATITNTRIQNNLADGFRASGGGIRNTGTMYVLNSLIAGNGAYESGGGVFTAIGQLYLTNSTVSGNFANNAAGFEPCPGGGIYNAVGINMTGGVILTNSTITNNRAGRAGGICNKTGATVVARNSIIAGNIGTITAPDFSGIVTSEGYNLIGNTTGNSGWIATDVSNANPLLGPLGSNGGFTWTHALLPNGPAINAGNNDLARDPFDNSPLLNDQRGPGFRRLIENVDIGAYEANYSMVPVTVGGRVTTSGGRGIAGARVTFTSGGTTLYAQTNPFGYYRFANLPPGTTYTVAAMHKYYLFPAPVYVTIDQNRSDLNFTAQ